VVRKPWGLPPGGPRLFAPHPALVRIADEMEPAGTPGTATLAFALDADGPATLTIRAADGVVAKTLTVQGVAGLNIVTWNLLLDANVASEARRPAAPADYRVTVAAGGRSAESSLRLNRFARWTR